MLLMNFFLFVLTVYIYVAENKNPAYLNRLFLKLCG